MTFTRDHVKPLLAAVHTAYLCEHLNLRVPENKAGFDGLRPDFMYDDIDPYFFELKTRTLAKYRKDRGRTVGAYTWWELPSHQIAKYEQYMPEDHLFWIFMVCVAQKKPTELDHICEQAITFRDIYVLPWDIYRAIEPTANDKRHISLERLLELGQFPDRDRIEKGELHIALSIWPWMRDLLLY